MDRTILIDFGEQASCDMGDIMVAFTWISIFFQNNELGGPDLGAIAFDIGQKTLFMKKIPRKLYRNKLRLRDTGC